MIEQHNNQVNNNRSNGEDRCILCLKNTLDEYSFQFEDLCHFIIKTPGLSQSRRPNMVRSTGLEPVLG